MILSFISQSIWLFAGIAFVILAALWIRKVLNEPPVMPDDYDEDLNAFPFILLIPIPFVMFCLIFLLWFMCTPTNGTGFIINRSKR